MTVEEQLEMMTKFRHAMDAEDVWLLDRKAIIIMLAANFIVVTNEIIGGDRTQAMKMVDDFRDNIRDLVNQGIDSGGMRIDGVSDQMQ